MKKDASALETWFLMVLDVLMSHNVLVIMMVIITTLEKLSLLTVTPGKYDVLLKEQSIKPLCSILHCLQGIRHKRRKAGSARVLIHNTEKIKFCLRDACKSGYRIRFQGVDLSEIINGNRARKWGTCP